MIHMWRGHHSEELIHTLEQSWMDNDLFIVCPHSMRDFSFIKYLPKEEISFEGAWDRDSAINIQPENPGLYPARPVLGVFTSGTTSPHPKLVLYSKDNVESSLRNMRSVFDISRIGKIFSYPSPVHAFGLILGYMHSILYKIPLVNPTGVYGKNFHQKWMAIENHNLLTLGTPTHFEDLKNSVKSSGYKPRGSYSAIAGGAQVSVSLWKELKSELGIEKPSIGYGATETCLGVTHHPPGLQPKEDGEIGFPLPMTKLEVNESGVTVSGPTVCAAVIESGLIRLQTSVVLKDVLVRREEDGMYSYQGRLDLILNRGGTKYSLEYIEHILSRESAGEVICVSIRDKRLGEELGVIATSVKKEDIFESLKNEFGHSFNERNFISVDSIPKSGNLKTDRAACKKLLQNSIYE